MNSPREICGPDTTAACLAVNANQMRVLERISLTPSAAITAPARRSILPFQRKYAAVENERFRIAELRAEAEQEAAEQSAFDDRGVLLGERLIRRAPDAP